MKSINIAVHVYEYISGFNFIVLYRQCHIRAFIVKANIDNQSYIKTHKKHFKLLFTQILYIYYNLNNVAPIGNITPGLYILAKQERTPAG